MVCDGASGERFNDVLPRSRRASASRIAGLAPPGPSTASIVDFDDRGDPSERNLPFYKRSYRDFVCGGEDGRRRPTLGERLVGEANAGEALGIGPFEVV